MHIRIRQVADLLAEYAYPQPFHLFLKEYFRKHKQAGSTDRREITNLCYRLFRTGSSLQMLPFDERLMAAQFLCADDRLIQER